ncbi:hypothetical protein PCC7424_5098 [Gloeothece citriformis PCC 7424]|uniref:Uncharacterized protein n=1 Tax=Gloeothece citriformis (strain PCC 7424) TaxID=65393 RepID=B7KGW2_GLOC7|nr:hypothetical protein PCC7424_5098 [Gloeothece citriformis PCC 7424]
MVIEIAIISDMTPKESYIRLKNLLVKWQLKQTKKKKS